MSIQTNIQSGLETMSPKLRRIASTVLERPPIVVESTITELAQVCDTSDATIVRFCRAIGFSGYPQFKSRLTAELAKESTEFGAITMDGYGSEISPRDSLPEMVTKIASSEIRGIRETAESLDMAVLEQVIQKVARAKRVVLFGVSASNSGAQDLSQKLLRIGINALAFHDAHDALVTASLLSNRDVAIGFSHSGRTKETISFLNAARRAGAYTVAVSNTPKSALSDVSDVLLRTAVRETTFRSGAMASRSAQLTIVDYIFVGVSLGHFEKTVRVLKSTHDVVQELTG